MDAGHKSSLTFRLLSITVQRLQSIMTKWGKLTLVITAVLAFYMSLRIEWGFENFLTLLTGILIGICFAGMIVWWRYRNW